MKCLTIIFLYALSYARAHTNICCPDNALIVDNNCTTGKLWITEECLHGAYIMPSEEFYKAENDTIKFTDDTTVVPRNKYCLGTMDTNEKVALICFDAEDMEEVDGQMTSVARLICCIISVVCLILTLTVYIILPNLRDLQGKCMMVTIFSLLMAFIFLAVLQNHINFNHCVTVASLVYFWFICVFFWLNIASFNVWRSVVRPKLLSSKKYLFLYYNIYGWGGPLLFLMIVLICNHAPGNHIKPNFGVNSCWFSGSKAVRIFFYAPISVLLLINIFLFISTSWTLAKQDKIVVEKKHRSHKFKFCLYLKLFILMGICWIFEPMSDLLFVQGSYLWIVTDYINSLQGLIIFFLLVVFRKRVRRDLARKEVCCRKLPSEWATMPDEDCEELEEEVDELTSTNDNNVQVVNRP